MHFIGSSGLRVVRNDPIHISVSGIYIYIYTVTLRWLGIELTYSIEKKKSNKAAEEGNFALPNISAKITIFDYFIPEHSWIYIYICISLICFVWSIMIAFRLLYKIHGYEFYIGLFIWSISAAINRAYLYSERSLQLLLHEFLCNLFDQRCYIIQKYIIIYVY